jgi:hypothetical protein
MVRLTKASELVEDQGQREGNGDRQGHGTERKHERLAHDAGHCSHEVYVSSSTAQCINC